MPERDPVSAVALYGSQARGNPDERSDVDILVVTRERRTRHVMMGNISFYHYPWSNLVRKARAGDLFVCHIVKESRSLYDPAGRFGALGNAFRLKTSYNREIRNASDLGWYIAHHYDRIAEPVVAKRIAWCVRTILIARSAEEKNPLFAADALANFSGCRDVADLIGLKNDARPPTDAIPRLRRFLTNFGSPDPHHDGDIQGFLETFRKRRNFVAKSTLDSGSSDEPYSAN